MPSCGWGVTLQWSGRWLLFITPTNEGAVIDTTGRDASIQLADILKPGLLPGSFDLDFGIDASWAQEGGNR